MKNIHHYKNKKLVNNVFDNVYQNYDLMNDIMSFGSHRLWKEEFVKSLDLNLEYKIVDMASGTGDISYSILKKNKHQKIYRIEPNFNMLNHNISKFNNFKNIFLFYNRRIYNLIHWWKFSINTRVSFNCCSN